MRFSATEVATHLGATLVGPDVELDGASIDSRSIAPGQLFVPIVAERDGHTFIAAALEAGAAAYLSAHEAVGGCALVVEDTAVALMDLGRLARRRVSGGVIGITGSVGKTTTKDLVRRCMASTFRTAASERSFNNELGLPLTLFNAPDDTEWAVLEMGARETGHIARLTAIARPDVGIVTSVAMAHVEFFGSLDGVAKAKGELVESLPAHGVAVLNLDDPRVAAMAAFSPCPVLGYAVESEAEVRAENVTLDGELRAHFTLATPWGSGEVRLGLHGLQQVPNAVAAAAAALWCQVPFEAVLVGLAEATGSPLRMEVHRLVDGPLLVADCYNANPASTEAALRSLGAVPAGRRMALLGLMAELGEATVSEHARMADLADALGIEVVGYQCDLYGASRVDDVGRAVALLDALGPGDAVLVKGSRVAQLEDVVLRYESERRGPPDAV